MLPFKWFRYLPIMVVVLIVTLIINYGLIQIVVSNCSSEKNTLTNNQALLSNNSRLDTIVRDSSMILSINQSNDCNNQTKSLPQPSNVTSLDRDYVLSLERRTSCNLQKPNNCVRLEKSLVITFWSEKSKNQWVAQNLLTVFPEQYFEYIVMVHDNSSWIDYPAYDKIIWIHVKDQVRFWFIKRFLSPHIFRAYRYIWVIDDDIRFSFNPRVYECIADIYDIPLSAPGRGKGVIVHLLTKVFKEYISHIGRWTDFVEVGPVFVAKGSLFDCLWHLLSEKSSAGYALDTKWCNMLSALCPVPRSNTRVCALLDAFVVDHESNKINSIPIGAGEVPVYLPYVKYYAKGLIYGPIAPNSTDLDLCTKKLS